MRRPLLALAMFSAWWAWSTTPALAQWYVDAVNGNDAARGDESAPWKTLDHARLNAPAGATVTVRAGTYPALFESSVPVHRTSWVTFRAAPGVKPQIGGIKLSYPSLRNAYLRFEGFDILSSDRSIVAITRARYVELANNEIRGTRWWISGTQGRYGVDVDQSRDIQVGLLRGTPLANHGNWIHEIHRAVQVGDSQNVSVLGNYAQPKAGTAIQWLGGNAGGLIRANHLSGDVPDGNATLAASAHASIISIRSSGLTISGNQMHGMGSSSGVMTYTPDAAGGETSYNDLLIENNALYDTHPQALRFYNLGTNVLVRNNLIAPRYRKAAAGAAQCAPFGAGGVGVIRDNRQRHYVSLTVHSTAAAHSLKLHNNVFIGTVHVPASNVEDRSNVIWSMLRGGAWAPAGLDARTGSEVLHGTAGRGCGTHDPRFENGQFFVNAAIDYHFPGTALHQWRLAPSSSALNFGDATLAPNASLGSVDRAGAFLRLDGIPRDSTHHSAGPVER